MTFAILFVIIYSVIRIISFSYYNFNTWVALVVDILTFVGVIYVIETIVKKIDKHHDE